MNNPLLSKLTVLKDRWVFVILWLITFSVYVATRKAGWVIDGVGFLYNMKHQKFWDFINTTYSADQGFYQLYALHYYIFYKIWGMSEWMWGVLYLTLHALNALLIFKTVRRLLSDSAVRHAALISLAGAVIFTFSPHISEVLVWRACFHYLLSFLFLLLIISATQHYQHKAQWKKVWTAILLFILSACTHPIFYLTPFFVLSLAFYYRIALGYDKLIFRKTILHIFTPQVVLLGIYFIALYLIYGTIRPHKTEFSESIPAYLSKPAKYLFHIIFLGRYFSKEIKDSVYHFCETLPAIVFFYSLVASYFLYSVIKIQTLRSESKAILLLSVWSAMTLFLVMPVAFPMSALWIFYDRYIYFSAPFIYTVCILSIVNLIKNRYLLIGIFCAYIDVNLFFHY